MRRLADNLTVQYALFCAKILPESKLQSLYTQLKLQDKEEVNYKQYRAEKDKDGTMAAKLRSKLVEIMRNYELLIGETADRDFDKKNKGSDKYKNRSLFKDQKLSKLWENAEVAGLSPDELDSLREEFHHYQDKVDIYSSLLDSLNESTENRLASTCAVENKLCCR